MPHNPKSIYDDGYGGPIQRFPIAQEKDAALNGWGPWPAPGLVFLRAESLPSSQKPKEKFSLPPLCDKPKVRHPKVCFRFPTIHICTHSTLPARSLAGYILKERRRYNTDRLLLFYRSRLFLHLTVRILKIFFQKRVKNSFGRLESRERYPAVQRQTAEKPWVIKKWIWLRGE